MSGNIKNTRKFKRPLTKDEETRIILEKEKRIKAKNIKERHKFIDDMFKKYE